MEGVLFCTVLLSQIAEHAPPGEGVNLSHGLWGVIGMVVGAVVGAYFRYRGHVHATDSKAKTDNIDLVFREGQRLRNELMAEILENRKQVTDLQREHLNCQKENMELKTAQVLSNNAIKALQDENSSLKTQIAEMQKQIKQLKGAE
jgi:septal ring factor EnvC (AmiA/AmiB activator)